MITDLMASSPLSLAIVAGVAWVVFAVTSIRRARKGGNS